MTSEEQYEQIKKCYYCNGFDLKCELNPYYLTNTDRICGWKKTIEADLIKMEAGGCMTFPILEQIIKNEENGGNNDS